MFRFVRRWLSLQVCLGLIAASDGNSCFLRGHERCLGCLSAFVGPFLSLVLLVFMTRSDLGRRDGGVAKCPFVFGSIG